MVNWQLAVITLLLLTHISGVVWSIYVHRGMGHHYFIFKPALSHAFRFWLWFATGMVWPNWQQHYAAKHRKHHKYSDTEQDPTSPWYYTINQILDVSHVTPNGANYISQEEIKLYAPDIISSDDWIERNVYCKYPKFGLLLYWLLMWLLFGTAGFVLGAINYFFIGTMFIFFGNYAYHKIGFTYAINNGSDKSRILCPWGIFQGGEELHAHHHTDSIPPYFHRHWWEIDIGWQYSRVLIALGLMKLTNSTFP